MTAPEGIVVAIEERYEALGSPVRVTGSSRLGGSSFFDTLGLTVEVLDGSGPKRLFVKSGSATERPNFEAEARGLSLLASVSVLATPADPWVGKIPTERDSSWFLAMEQVEAGPRESGFFERFGRQLANLHRASIDGSTFGLDWDNFIGSTPQVNKREGLWIEFYRRHRLGFQLRLARQRNLSTSELDRLGGRLIDRLSRWIDLPEEPPCLQHGDLWSGNYLVGPSGEPVLIDPAIYYGHRETDLAMTRLFGGYPQGFYDAYQEEWPLPAGWKERLPIYQLYHQLNHLNLFGSGYLSGCLSTLRRYVG